MATETLPGYDDWKTHNPPDKHVALIAAKICQ